ncbi:MAG: hypothetical protein KGS10_04125 [Chloroflexi bacterium]|nr:hypothetical protein [Chloroflexota bacterium]
MIDITTTLDTLSTLSDPSLRAWLHAREGEVAEAIGDTNRALRFAEEFDRVFYRLPKSQPEMLRLSEQISAFPLDKVKRWRAILPRGSASHGPYPFRLIERLKVEIEREEGAVRWVRKDEVEREDGAAKHVTNGTRVIARPSRSSRTPKMGGVVIGTAAANEGYKRQAKDAVGTTAAVLVRFDPAGR